MSTAGFFTLGVTADRYDLPHPRIEWPVVLLIRRVLLRAFALLREGGKINLANASENQITASLRSVIENDLRQTGEVKGFSKRAFDFVGRQGEWQNYDGTKIGKAPDIFFKLRYDDAKGRPVLSEFEGLFVEAKPVDASHPTGSKYCDDGLIRFVNGDYAWAMQDAMMLAYARKGRTIAEDLIPAMSESKRLAALGTSQLPEPCNSPAAAACPEAEAVHVSIHERSFLWPDGKGQANSITVYHLWHHCS